MPPMTSATINRTQSVSGVASASKPMFLKKFSRLSPKVKSLIWLRALLVMRAREASGKISSAVV